MEELDFLKQHWKSDQQFPQVQAETLRKMLHKKSSSIIRWIFIISVLELFVGLLFVFFIPLEKEPQLPFFTYLEGTLDLLFYVCIGYFIYSFFKDYTQIRTYTDTKALLGSILKTRKHVDHYITFNIYWIFGSCALVIFERISTAVIEHKEIGEIILTLILCTFVIGILLLITIPIVRFYYRILYRRLTEKLENNYQEILELESNFSKE